MNKQSHRIRKGNSGALKAGDRTASKKYGTERIKDRSRDDFDMAKNVFTEFLALDERYLKANEEMVKCPLEIKNIDFRIVLKSFLRSERYAIYLN